MSEIPQERERLAIIHGLAKEIFFDDFFCCFFDSDLAERWSDGGSWYLKVENFE